MKKVVLLMSSFAFFAMVGCGKKTGGAPGKVNASSPNGAVTVTNVQMDMEGTSFEKCLINLSCEGKYIFPYDSKEGVKANNKNVGYGYNRDESLQSCQFSIFSSSYTQGATIDITITLLPSEVEISNCDFRGSLREKTHPFTFTPFIMSALDSKTEFTIQKTANIDCLQMDFSSEGDSTLIFYASFEPGYFKMNDWNGYSVGENITLTAEWASDNHNFEEFILIARGSGV